MPDEPIREQLIARARKARALQADLAARGALADGAYHPELEAMDAGNADYLAAVFDALGWPGRAKVGDDGAAAAVQLLQRGVSRPDLQRRALSLMMEAAGEGQANMIDVAHFADRVAVFEGKPQLFGTQLDWSEAGELVPAPMEPEEDVAARRAAVGLPPLEELLAHARSQAGAKPADHEARRAAFEAWARRVGWR